MSGEGDAMGQLVDAFRGLAAEGNKTCLADVELIVNNYFTRHTSPAFQPPPGGSSPSLPPPGTPPLPAGGGYAYPDIDESPIKPPGDRRPSPPKRRQPQEAPQPQTQQQQLQQHRAASNVSSAGSLRAWGDGGGRAGSGEDAGPGGGCDAGAERDTREVLSAVMAAEHDDFYSRSVHWQQRQRHARDHQRMVNMQRETEHCTWKPEINHGHPATGTTRTVFGKVEDRLQAARQIKEDRLEYERRRLHTEEVASCTFHPRVNNPAPADPNESSRTAAGGDTFERLYSDAQKGARSSSAKTGRKQGGARTPRKTPEGTPRGTVGTPVFYTTFPPAAARAAPEALAPGKTQVNMNLSLDEIAATERELRQIEELLNAKLHDRSRLRAETGVLSEHATTVESNYVDSEADDAEFDSALARKANAPLFDDNATALGSSRDGSRSPDRSTGGRVLRDFTSFLIRQNAYEERKRSNRAFIEADTAPALHPVIARRSKQLGQAAKERSGVGESTGDSILQGKGGTRSSSQVGSRASKEGRVCKLAAECHELRAEVFRLCGENEGVLKKLAVLSKQQPRTTPGGGAEDPPEQAPVPADKAAFIKQMRHEVRSLRPRGRDRMVHPVASSEPLHVWPASEHLQAVLERPVDEQKTAVRDGLSAVAPQDAVLPTLTRWIRELLEVKASLSEIRVRLTKAKETLGIELKAMVADRGGRVSWETVVEMDYNRRTHANSKIKMEDVPKSAPTKAKVNDHVHVRREPWQAWEKGTLVSLTKTAGTVLLDSTSKTQSFPATERTMRPVPAVGCTFSPKIKERNLLTCMQTNEPVTVTVDGAEHTGRVVSEKNGQWGVAYACGMDAAGKKKVKRVYVAASEISRSTYPASEDRYGPKSLGTYVQQLEEDKRKADEKRERTLLDRRTRETVECTHAPLINAAPEFVTRIATSMQLLRGEAPASAVLARNNT
ncbi:hypothetical protein DIPPA_00654 [Diplonema papillatum]|nr:hypothetical protein DIPPA_00654 [Diplonema papillatum]|eukprot:gene7586-11614_t